MDTTLLAFGLGSQELLIVAGLLLVFFGGAKLPELMRGVGEGMREFKKSSQESTLR